MANSWDVPIYLTLMGLALMAVSRARGIALQLGADGPELHAERPIEAALRATRRKSDAARERRLHHRPA